MRYPCSFLPTGFIIFSENSWGGLDFSPELLRCEEQLVCQWELCHSVAHLCHRTNFSPQLLLPELLVPWSLLVAARGPQPLLPLELDGIFCAAMRVFPWDSCSSSGLPSFPSVL